MWKIELRCDLCGDAIAAGEIPTAAAVGTTEVMERVRAEAYAAGGRHAVAWNGPPRWLCPRCAGPGRAPELRQAVAGPPAG